VTSLDLLSTYLLVMELHFGKILYSHLVIQILMRAISNVHAGCVWSADCRFSITVLGRVHVT